MVSTRSSNEGLTIELTDFPDHEPSSELESISRHTTEGRTESTPAAKYRHTFPVTIVSASPTGELERGLRDALQLWSWLTRHRVEISTMLDALSKDGVFIRVGSSSDDALTATERAILDQIGPPEPDAQATLSTFVAQRLDRSREFAELLRSSLRVTEAADLVGVTPARVRQRLNTDRSLWGFKHASTWRIPRWQFHDADVLWGIDTVVRAIPSDMDPIAVTRMMTLPNPDLVLDGSTVSVVDWLRAGGGPNRAARSVGSPTELV